MDRLPRLAAHDGVQKLGRHVSAGLDRRPDAGERGGREVADHLLVIDAEDGDFLRDPDASKAADVGRDLGDAVVCGEEGAGPGQVPEPFGEIRGPRRQVREGGASRTDGGGEGVSPFDREGFGQGGLGEGEVPELAGEEEIGRRARDGGVVAQHGGDAGVRGAVADDDACAGISRPQRFHRNFVKSVDDDAARPAGRQHVSEGVVSQRVEEPQPPIGPARGVAQDSREVVRVGLVDGRGDRQHVVCFASSSPRHGALRVVCGFHFTQCPTGAQSRALESCSTEN